MTTQNKLTQIVADLVNQAQNGVMLKNIRKGLESKNLPAEMINKLMRIVELEANLVNC